VQYHAKDGHRASLLLFKQISAVKSKANLLKYVWIFAMKG
jgi:hypothetical protein